jgi:hypothetical protein
VHEGERGHGEVELVSMVLVHQSETRPVITSHKALRRLEESHDDLYERSLSSTILPQKANTALAVDADVTIFKKLLPPVVCKSDIFELGDRQLQLPPPIERELEVVVFLEVSLSVSSSVPYALCHTFEVQDLGSQDLRLIFQKLWMMV